MPTPRNSAHRAPSTPALHAEVESQSDARSKDALAGPQPSELDEPWPYIFTAGDSVWIRTVGGNWHHGKVTVQRLRKGATREKEGIFYPVLFGERIRKYFAPLNGEIKPDTLHVRQLLEEAGWI